MAVLWKLLELSLVTGSQARKSHSWKLLIIWLHDLLHPFHCQLPQWLPQSRMSALFIHTIVSFYLLTMLSSRGLVNIVSSHREQRNTMEHFRWPRHMLKMQLFKASFGKTRRDCTYCTANMYMFCYFGAVTKHHFCAMSFILISVSVIIVIITIIHSFIFIWKWLSECS